MSFPRPYGRYVLQERIAMGGMAEIFRAKTASEGFAKPVCIKRILPHFLESDTFVTMFRDEAALAARLQHANVVQVFDFGEEEGMLYLAMELVDGADLRKLLDRAERRGLRPTIGQTLQIGIEICRGLHHAHTLTDGGRPLGIVHRDISPHNVLVSRAGEVKITDFGIAKASERATHTSTGVVKGKLAYMAPEQAEGGLIDHRVDQFATGIILWELLTGRRLFTGENEASILRRVLMCDVPPPSRSNAAVPDAVEKVVLRALSADREARYPDMRALEVDLTRVLFALSVDPTFSDLRSFVTPLLVDDAAPRRTAIMPGADAIASEPTDEDPRTSSLAKSSIENVFTSSSEPRVILDGDGASAHAPTVAAHVDASDIDETIKVAPSPKEHTGVTRTSAFGEALLASSSSSVLPSPSSVPSSVPREEPPQSVPTVPARRTAASFDSTSEPVAFPRKTSDEELVPTERVRRDVHPAAARTSRPSLLAIGAIGAVVVAVLALAATRLSDGQGGDATPATAAMSAPTPVEPTGSGAPPDAAPAGIAESAPPSAASGVDTPAVASVDEGVAESDAPAAPTDDDRREASPRATGGTVDAERGNAEPSGARAPARRATSSPRERPAPAEVKKGSVLVDVPGSWAIVYVGKKKLGETPTRLELPIGKHRLRLVNPETGREKTVSVTITADKTARVAEQL